jgi:hypothetical protein
MKKYNFQPEELIPPYTAICPMPTSIDDIIYCGDGNIQQLIRLHREWESRMRRRLDNPKSLKRGDEKEQIAITGRKIACLTELKKGADQKPVFPMLRAWNHFNEGDKVICYVVNWPDDYDIPLVADSDWVFGEILGAPSYIGSRYPIRFVTRVHGGEFLEGHGGTFTVIDPCLLHRWEYEYLAENIDYVVRWSRNVEKPRVEERFSLVPGGMLARFGVDLESL